MNFIKTSNRIAALFLAFIMAAVSFTVPVSAAGENTSSVVSKNGVITDGIYNISNTSSGKYLEAFDYKFDSQGRMHLDGRRYVPAQNFAIIGHGDGTYSICPQNDEAIYMLECRSGSKAGASVYKSNVNDVSTRFRITLNADGSFRIRPASTELSGFSLAESKTNFAHYYYSLCELQRHSNDASQKWKLELTDQKINISVSINKTQDTVRQYTVNQLYTVVTPAAYSDMVTWTTSDKKIAIVDDNGSYCAFANGNVTITATVAGKSVSCNVTITDKVAYAWYSQCNMYTGGWNAAALKDLYFYAYGIYKPFMIDGFNGKMDWMDEGCALCCCAMVLRNLNARMTDGYDFRSGQSTNIEADPYTCALANTYNHGSRTGKGVLNYDPIYTAMSLVASRFTVNGKAITTETQYYANKRMIKEALDKHPEGVVVGMDSYYYGSHYIVITECVNPDAKNPEDYRFRVCDPAAYDPAFGNNVLFEDSASYKDMYYRYYDMWTLITFKVAD